MLWLAGFLALTQAPATESLAARLGVAEEALAAERWSTARDALVAAAVAYEGTPEALVERARLVRMLERAAFWSEHDAPALTDLFGGAVTSFSERTGSVRFAVERNDRTAFEAGDLHGLAEHDGVLPLRFTDDLEISVEGGNGGRYEAGLMFGLGRVGVFRLTPVPGGAELRQLFRGSRKPREYALLKGRKGQAEDYVVSIKKQKIGLELGKRFVGRWDVGMAVEGYVALGAAFEFDRLELEGRLDMDGVRLLLDEHLEAARRDFREARVVDKLLPRKLRLRRLPRHKITHVRLMTGACPFPLSAEGRESMQMIIDLWDEDEYEEGLTLLESTSLSSEARKWTAGYLHFVNDGEVEAFKAWKSLADADQPLSNALPWYVYLLDDHGEPGVYEETLTNLLEDEKYGDWAYQTLAWEKLHQGDHAAVREIIRSAALNGSYGRELDEIAAFLVKAELGPAWETVHVEESEHYVVTSNIDRRTCVEAARHLENGLKRFSRELLPANLPESRKFQVYLFRGLEGYSEYLDQLMGDRREGSAGIYSGALEQLLIWETPDREAMFRTIRHEGFHQYFDVVAKDIPFWLNEGLAEYWEGADFTKSSSRMVPDRPAYWAFLAKDLEPLERLIGLGPGEFWANAEWAYPQSWGFVYFLQHSSKQNAAIFQAILDGIAQGASAQEAVDRAFMDVPLKKLGAAFRDYIFERRP